MEQQFSIAEAKNKLTAIIHAVENGPAVKLTRYGRPVAVLLSASEYDRLRGGQGKFWSELVALRKIIDEGGVEITGADFEGLRDPSPGRDMDFQT